MFSFRLHSLVSFFLLAAALCLCSWGAWSQEVLGEETLIAPGAVWKYADTGTDLGTGWRDVIYDDSRWASEPAQLGYGDDGEATVISYGPDSGNKYPCYYFRHSFSVEDPAAYESVSLKVLRDDGCVVYLNGTEVARSNMPSGEVTYNTWASTVVGGGDESAWHEFSVDSGVLLTGTNVIAVELHQSSGTSTDVSFDLELIGEFPAPPVPEVTLVSPADESVLNDTFVSFTCSATDDSGLFDATLYIGNQPQTVTFSGPTHTDDAQISAGHANTNYGSDTVINVDGLDPHAHAVIKSLNVFGGGPGQAPLGSSIVSATLEINCFDSGNKMQLYRLTEDWVESEVTWNDCASGVPWTDPGADGLGSHGDVALDGDCASTGWRSLDITPFVQEWSDGAPNYGVVLTDTGTEGVDFYSSESSNPPVLTVTYQTDWQPVETQPLSAGTSDTVTFDRNLDDQEDYVWNCLVTNTSVGQSWAPADFRVRVDTNAPNEPVLVAPADGAIGVSTSPTLEVTVSDPNGDSLEVTFYGRRASGATDFTIVALPDTQKYSLSYPDIFTAQTQWIVDNVTAHNIVFVTHEGDIVDTWDSTSEWERANTSMSLLDGVVPYSVVPGDHDHYGEDPNGSTEYYEQYFPASRFTSYPSWGGSYAGNYGGDYEESYPHTNNSNYQLLTVGGQEYIFLSLDFCPSQDEIDWANGVLTTYSERKAILTTHGLLDTNADYKGSGDFWLYPDGSSNPTGDTSRIWYDLIRNHENLQIVLCGHMHGEARRTDNNLAGKPVYQILANYQGRANGGDGWLRIMRFAPAENKVYVETYSPWLGQYETDADSQFTLDFPMSGFSVIGTDTDVPTGSNASVVWPGLSLGTQYEWYVTVTDPTGKSRVGPVWQFTTTSVDLTPPVISNVDAVDITDNTATIVWATDELADSLVEYGLSTEYGSEPSHSSLVTSHSITLTDLTPYTTYHYRVTSKDAAGNSSASGDFSFTTLQEPPPVYDYATADYATEIGSITRGSYVDTHEQDDSAEALTEAVKEQGKPSKRHDELSHIWTFDVTGGNSVVFYVDACKTVSADGDDFIFSYSTDGVSYIDMVTVTKTAHDDNYRSCTLPNTVKGIVYIRVQDSDMSSGNRNLDTLYVDHMYILSGGSPPDLPPEPPQNLVAVAGDLQVELDWDNNTEPDLDRYVVCRSLNAGGPYNWLADCSESWYMDYGVTNGTTYYYVVTAVDGAGQESGFSNQVSATPGVWPTLRVLSIDMSKAKRGKNWSAVAKVTVVDQDNYPVEGANVSHSWSGVHTGSGQALTESNGAVRVTSDPSKEAGQTTFTVDSVSKAGYDYDAAGSQTSASIIGP